MLTISQGDFILKNETDTFFDYLSFSMFFLIIFYCIKFSQYFNDEKVERKLLFKIYCNFIASEKKKKIFANV